MFDSPKANRLWYSCVSALAPSLVLSAPPEPGSDVSESTRITSMKGEADTCSSSFPCALHGDFRILRLRISSFAVVWSTWQSHGLKPVHVSMPPLADAFGLAQGRNPDYKPRGQ